MVNFKGEIIAESSAHLTLNNRGYAYGDSLFETIRVINNKIMFWETHYFRLMASMRIMRMEIPMNFSPEFLEDEILTLIQANEFQDQPARVKLSVHRKEGGLYTPKNREVDYFIQASTIENPFYTLDEKERRVELYKDHYLIGDLLSTLKTNNRAINVLGSIYAEENDYDNCLLLNEKKSVVEALNGNLFLVKGNQIKTPKLTDGCINGVIRKQLIEIIKKTDDFELEETSISPFELQKADELWVTNVIVGIQPISQYRKKKFDRKVAQQFMAKLNTAARMD